VKLYVTGIHTPEFSVEHDIDLVRRATKERAKSSAVSARV
jgi:hypothetical protein